MKYDFENMIIYNKHGVYYKVYAYRNDAIYIKAIKKPIDSDKFNFVYDEDLLKNKIDIMYIGTKSNIPEGRLN